MQRTEHFHSVFFPESVVREAAEVMEKTTGGKLIWRSPSVVDGSVEWEFDNETEFFAEYSNNLSRIAIYADSFKVLKNGETDPYARHAHMWIHYLGGRWSIQVWANKREYVLAPFAVFRKALEQHTLPAPPPPAAPPLKIFIGHGRSSDWRSLKDALQDHHGFEVEAFETKPRAGYTIPEVIESMAQGNALALMVLTAEDEQFDGSVRARENVVHEVGYFQGRLGNKRAILIMEDGVNEFSNIHGIVHLPYKNIREVTGEVLAVIKREFPHALKH